MPVRLLIIAVLLALSTSPASAAEWGWPVHGPVVERFRVGPDRFAAGQHRGVDVAAPVGTGVRSACAGTVTFAGFVGAGGRTVSVRCGALTATYQHLSAVVVRRGESVAAGTRLAAVGRSGRPRSPLAHLHFGVHRTADHHAYIDPLTLLGEDGGARPGAPPLLPAAPRPRGGAPLGPAPRKAATRQSPHPRVLIQHPVAAARGGTPIVVWVGAGLALLGLPGFGLRWRRRSLAARRASAQKALASAPGSG